MKKTLLSVMALAGALVMNAQNPFAYGLASEDYDATETSTFKVQYSLNADATAVKLQVLNGETVVAETACEGKTKGSHVAEIDLSGLENGEYTWQIAVTGGETSGASKLFRTLKFYHPSDLDVDNSFESPSFGTIFVAEGYTEGKTSGYVSAQANGTDGGGLYMFTPELESITNKNGGFRFYSDELTFSRQLGTSTSGADFSKVAIADDGRIFVARHNYEGDYILSAPSVASLVEDGVFTSLVKGLSFTDEKIYTDASGNYIVGAVQGMDVKGSGNNTKILASTRIDNKNETGSKANRIVEYSLGNKTQLPEPTPTALDYKYVAAYDRSSNVVYDNRGGIWFCQYRGTPTDAEPALVYVDANGVEQYFEGTGGKVRRRAAISVSPDGTHLVASSAAGKITVYEISYTENGKVNLTEVETVSAGGNNMYSAAWDCAGNFYCGNASSEYVKGYAVPRANNTFATKAASKYGFTKEGGVITEVETIKAENAPVEYYNLQGVKVENPSNGIFIKKQGAKATKVIL